MVILPVLDGKETIGFRTILYIVDQNLVSMVVTYHMPYSDQKTMNLLVVVGILPKLDDEVHGGRIRRHRGLHGL